MTDREILELFIITAENFAQESDNSCFDITYTTSSGYQRTIKVEIVDNGLEKREDV